MNQAEKLIGGFLTGAIEDPTGQRDRGASFDYLYQTEYRSVVALAYVLSGSRAGAEDIAQEAFLATHRNWKRIVKYEQPGAWVRRVAANIAVSLFRRRMIEARALARLAAEPARVSMMDDQDAEFWAAVRSLPTRQAQVVALHYLEDLPVIEIARVLDCAEGTVKAHLHKARRSLARRLSLDEGQEPE